MHEEHVANCAASRFKIASQNQNLASFKWKQFADDKSLVCVNIYGKKKMDNAISKREIEFLFQNFSRMRSERKFVSQIKYNMKNTRSDCEHIGYFCNYIDIQKVLRYILMSENR